MNTTLNTHPSAAVDTQFHPPQSLAPVHHVVRRVGLADRVALRLGLALVTWSRRPSSARSSRELVLQRAEREWLAQRAQLLNLPPR